MTKRAAGSDDGPLPKRHRDTTTTATDQTTTVRAKERHEINSSQDLHLVLAFHQDVGPVPKQRINSFKSFLASIANAAESDDLSAKRKLLFDYLQSQALPEGREAPAYLGDIIKTWHLAAQSNADSLFASVVAMLALLLQTISSFIDFRQHGNRLCTIILHDEQIQLLDRGLSTYGAKDYLVSPCLQLLTEIVVFDGGHAAGTLYRQREITFKRLDSFLAMRKDTHGDNPKGLKRRSVRQTALGYLLANLRLQSPAAKVNIIAQGKVLHALLDDMAKDPPSVILEILEGLRRDIAMDAAIPPAAKGRLFNQWTLGQLTTLYGYNESASSPDGRRGIQTSVHDFLLLLCTSPGCGLVETRTVRNVGAHVATTNKALESISRPDVTDRLNDENRHARRNPRLQQFLQTLKPYASVPQCDLILAVFQNLPELIPDYFSSGKNFPFDPKLTTTWVGYSSFLRAAIAVPLPESLTPLNDNDPVPHLYGTIMESIIPRPCTQRTMTRCLNQEVDLLKLFTLQILNAAFEKFAKWLKISENIQHSTDDQQSKLVWYQVESKLRDDFCEYIPDLRHVISQFRNCPRESTVLRESLTRLIAFYYRVIPQVALEEKFDISVTLSTALMDIESLDENHEQGGMRLLEFEHLLEIAHRSPNMQWWHKPESMWLSPFTMLLRLYVDRIQVNAKSKQIGTLLNTVITENQILRSNTSRASLDRLVFSLQDFEEWKASGRVFEFLDQCILRLVRKPVHYYDILTDLIGAAELDINPRYCQVDLLLITIVDQWRFLVESAGAPTLTNVSEWLVRFIEVTNLENGYNEDLPLHNDTTKLLSQIRDQLKSNVQDTDCRAMFERTLEERPQLGIMKYLVAANTTSETGYVSRLAKPSVKMHSRLPETVLPPGPPDEHEDHPGLHQWTRHEVKDAISEGYIKALILCLCSKHVGIRKQALTGIRSFMMRLEVSGYNEWQQTYMLVGEIVETATKVIDDHPLAYYAGVLAAGLFLVLSDPLHFMYAKVNDFLNRGPEWNVTKLPSYWVNRVLMNPPTDDDSHHQEAEWLLDGLIDGLRTSADMDIYRKCHVFERLLSLSASPSLPEPCFQKILEILFRCTYVKGSSTLITRCGLISWISSRLASHAINDMTGERLRMLASRAYETSDQERIDEWANKTIKCTLNSLQIARRR